MKKYAAYMLTGLLLATPVYAAKNEMNGEAGAPSQTEPHAPVTSIQPLRGSALPTATGNQVQNQVQTKNQGEETELKVATSEELKSQAAVAASLESLLSTPTAKSAIAQEMSEVATAQRDADAGMILSLAELKSRSPLLTKLVGPDKKTLAALKQIQAENQVRIRTLQEMQTQTKNQGELDKLSLAIEALTMQDTELASRIHTAETTPSLFGWILRLFAR